MVSREIRSCSSSRNFDSDGERGLYFCNHVRYCSTSVMLGSNPTRRTFWAEMRAWSMSVNISHDSNRLAYCIVRF